MILPNIYNQTITVLNKLKSSDTSDNTDVWYKNVIDNCAWYTQVERNVSNDTVSIATYITCLIPFNDNYSPYTQWKQSAQSGYTMSLGDYIILGSIPDVVTPNNIISVVKQYKPNVCIVKYVKELPSRYGTFVQLRIDGV